MLESLFGIKVRSLLFKFSFTLGLILICSFSIWGFFNIRYVKDKFFSHVVSSADRLGNTVRLGMRYAMMHNYRQDIQSIIDNVSELDVIKTIRVCNKKGEIKFSNRKEEIDRKITIKDRTCSGCHRINDVKPIIFLRREDRTIITEDEHGGRYIQVVTPIRNEEGCVSLSCHETLASQKILGILSVTVSLKTFDDEVFGYEKKFIAWIGLIFILTVLLLFFFFLYSVNIPIERLIRGTQNISMGNYETHIDFRGKDEMSQLADSINDMRLKIGEKQMELNRQRDEYRTLFELVPCLISVQDREYRLIGYNREFYEKFDPKLSDFCYSVYKGRDEKCTVCPVEQTFRDGKSHFSEETGITKSGERTHWIVRTVPIRDEKGYIVAAMEMSLDVTEQRKLQNQLARSEKQYYEIFNNIPNPIYVVDPSTFRILDCNENVKIVYGYSREEILSISFLSLFHEKEINPFTERMKDHSVFNQVRHLHKSGKTIFVSIRLSPSEYQAKKAILVTVIDITKRLETELQLIHSSKMATLGEMATGIAHELNQPLSVIKTASSYFMRKIRKNESIEPSVLLDISEEIDSHVERATKIINHMRQFGRKSDLNLEPVQLNSVLRSAFDIFSQQLKLREISVIWQLNESIPDILGDHNRLEQVVMNILINARDSIEERFKGEGKKHPEEKCIFIATDQAKETVVVTIRDNGIGIPKTLLEKIFEPFFTTKKVGKGTGLGLSISYSIVRECGGTIQALSEEGKGASFILQFPCHSEKRVSNP